MQMLEYTLLAGILFGLYFSLMGTGLNLIFGVMRIVNLAHGDFVMLGALGAYWAYRLAGVNPLLALVLQFVVYLGIGLPLYYLLVPRLLSSRDPEMLSLILFFGVSQVIEALAVIVVGNNPRSINFPALSSTSVNLFGQFYQTSWVVSAIISLLAIGLLYLYLYRTRLGIATRAVMGNREEAATSGIDVNRVSAIAFGIGIGLASITGVLAPFIIGSINPTMGVGLTVTAFTIIIVGSLGNPLGAIIGGLVYGISLMFMETYFSSWASILPYVLMLLILLVKPTGILGKGVRNA